MAQCKQTPQEFIQNCFCPMIAALCSSDADAVCQKNNLTFVEMLQPFCRLTMEAHIRDPGGASVSLRNLHLVIQDMNHRPVQATVAKKMLNEVMNMQHITDKTTQIQIGHHQLDIPLNTPWLESWRDVFLQVQYPADHEFIKHYLACMFVVSSSHATPLDQLQKLSMLQHQQQHQVPLKLPKWFSPSILKYYVLIHDEVDGDLTVAENVLQSMKTTYGSHLCHMLRINSRPLGQLQDHNHLPDPWSQFLFRRLNEQDKSTANSSSPQTPAEMSGVSDLPSQVTIAPNNIANSGDHTPHESHDIAHEIAIAQEVFEHANHPLSPKNEAVPCINQTDRSPNTTADMSTEDNFLGPLNVNVWLSTPHIPQCNNSISQHGICLTSGDMDGVRMLMNEFAIHALIPHVERQIRNLQDAVSNRKGVRSSIFNATKRWFSSNKPGQGMTVPNTVIYSQEAPELQIRRLGDLCFMFGHYTASYHAYHTAKKDYSADQAWMYYAGALEMAALSVFMGGEVQRPYPHNYMEESINTFLNICKVPHFATRATLLSTECLKSRGQYSEAAIQFIRMTSEDADLRSAIMVEQAAYSFLNSKPPMVRKYAFHMILSGHRYSKAGHRKHALRAYRQANQVYATRDWRLAEDHIHFTIARQSYNLRLLEDAVSFFSQVLSPQSKQSDVQQSAFLREYLHIHAQCLSEVKEKECLPQLPLPMIKNNGIKVLVVPPIPVSTPNVIPATCCRFRRNEHDERWHKLEEQLLSKIEGASSMLGFKPTTLCFSNSTNNINSPIAFATECISVLVPIHNPLDVGISLHDVCLLWMFTHDDNDNNSIVTSNETDSHSNVVISHQQSILLEGKHTKEVEFSIVANIPGHLVLKGLQYHLSHIQAPEDNVSHQQSSAVHGKQLFTICGPRQSNTKAEKCGTIYRVDKRLEIDILQPMPQLQIYFYHLPPRLLCGELREVTVEFRNVGETGLTNLHVASANPRLFLFAQSTNNNNNVPKSTPSHVCNIVIPKSRLEGGDSFQTSMWIRGPDVPGKVVLELLFYYQTVQTDRRPRYRLLQHVWEISVSNSLVFKTTSLRKVPELKKSEEIIITVQAKNMQDSDEILPMDVSILQVSTASKSWSVSEQLSQLKSSTLKPQEEMNICLKALHKEDSTITYSDIALSHKKVSSLSCIPYSSFYERHHWRLPSVLENTHNNDNMGNETDKVDTLHVDVCLTVYWEGRCEGMVVSGLHFLSMSELDTLMHFPPVDIIPTQHYDSNILPIFNTSQVTEEIQDENLQVLQRLVVYNVHHAGRVSHSFQSHRLCVVPVTVLVQNCSEVTLVVQVQTKNTKSVAYKNQLYSPHISQVFRWVGQVMRRLVLPPHSAQSLTMSIATCSPGTYNVGHLKVSCRQEKQTDADFLDQYWEVECPLVIDDI